MRSRGWTWTLNNPTEAEEESIRALDVQYVVYGKETAPETGTPHLQGYVYVGTSVKSLAQMKILIPRAHLEVTKGTAMENRTYCIKDGDYFEKGRLPTGKKTRKRKEQNRLLLEKPVLELVEEGEVSVYSVPRLVKARQMIANMKSQETAEGVRGVWIHGPPGTGKSHHARTEYPLAYIKSQNKWFDGYEGEEEIILDDLDSSALGHYIKIWTDKWPCSGETKGGKVQLHHKLFVITSNYTPELLWPDDVAMQRAIRRRCKFIQKLIVYNS